MATAVSDVTPLRSTSPQWARRYPPLLAVGVAMVIALAVLPSSLNLPQTSPATTLEYAPVPPEDEDPPPPNTGNLSSLGLAGSSSLESETPIAEDEDGEGPGLVDPEGKPKKGDDKDCVAGKQTEDPLAPPCSARFEGDNFGATYQGVTKDEVQVLIYMDGFTRYTGCSRAEVTPDGEYFDLGEEANPEEPEHCVVKTLRGWQKYFNERFQTYDRWVNFWVFFATGGLQPSAASRKADAADNYAKIKPFAVLSYAQENSDSYLDAMAKRGVLNFGAFVGRDLAFFRQYPKLIWGYYPPVEYQADIFTKFICTKVVNKPVSFSGNPGQNGQKRVLGMWSTRDKDRPELLRLATLVKEQVTACGGSFAADEHFPKAQYVQDNSTTPEYAALASANFQQAGVTTLIWPGGLETQLGKHSPNWHPEIVAMGDLNLEGNGEAQYQEPSFWSNAWMVTNITHYPAFEESYCYLAYTSVEPNVVRADLESTGCNFYNDVRQLFTGIQVAGPRLGPTSIDKGFHAIPRIISTDPRTPSCFYDPGDYTCTKDATLEWWDPAGKSPNNDRTGCYRMHQKGKRFLATTWDNSNVNVPARDAARDYCNGYNGSGLINPNPPSPD